MNDKQIREALALAQFVNGHESYDHPTFGRLADAVVALASEVERLTRELQHAVSENMAFNIKVAGEINEARQQRDAARAEVERLRKCHADDVELTAQLEAERDDIERQTAERIATAAREIESSIDVDGRAWVPVEGGMVTTLSDWIRKYAWRKP